MKFIRGDTFQFKFQRKNAQGGTIAEKPTQMYFTIKRNCGTTEKILQKSLDNGIVFSEEDYTYHVRIENEDTRDLECRNYVYDIQVITGSYIATISKGTVSLEEEVTYEYE